MPQVTALLADGLAPDRRELRVTMAIGAIDGVVTITTTTLQ